MRHAFVRLGRFIALFVLSVSSLSVSSALAQNDADRVRLQYASFDPAQPIAIPAVLRAPDAGRLWIVQFAALPTDAERGALRELGAEIHGYLPERAYVVRMDARVTQAVRAHASVRAVVPYHPAFRLEEFLVRQILATAPGDLEALEARRYHLVVVDGERDKAVLVPAITQLGGRIDHEQPKSILLDVTLDGRQLLQVAARDEVLWIDRWTPPEEDMDNGRIQGGGNYVETMGGYTGKGINAHVYEGLEATHKDFTLTPINVLSGGGADTHGHCTAGIVFGNGTSLAAARGMAPDVQPFYTQYSTVTSGYSRWQVVEQLVKTHQVMLTTASWGDTRTRAYTSVSADADDIIFDHDLIWSQSQSNAGNQDSRPQAWAKNIISIGAVQHRDNSNPADDSWAAGGGSTGPAADGRIKPDLCAYYDSILCSDRTGSAGYSTGDYTTGFGGTSGATPMVAGHNALAIQMYTDGLFGPLRVPNGTRWQNKPRFTTLKALQIANASQYPFTSSSTDNRREHVGWGFPDLKAMYDNRKVHFVVDETDVLTQGTGMAYQVQVATGQSELKISMCYADPAANPSAAYTRINDLSLRVTGPKGTKYWGNHGLTQGNWSLPDGARDERDTVENVFVQNPLPGTWTIEVLAYVVAQDSHVETPATDADFGLVVNGGVFVAKQPVTMTLGSVASFGKGCEGSRAPNAECVSANLTGTLAGSTGYPDVTYLLEVVAPAPLQVTGFEIQLASRTAGNVGVAAYLYDADASGTPRQLLASGTMTVAAANGFCSTTLNQNVPIAQGQRFFIGFKNANPTITVGTLRSGSTVPYWRNNGTGGSWVRFTSRAWSYRVKCVATGGVEPTLGHDGVPELGGKYTMQLRLTIPSSAALLFTGFSDQSWAGVPLPFDMTLLGAKGCTLYTGGEIVLPVPTGALGESDVVMVVPNDKGYLGVTFFHQWIVLDTKANSLGFVTTTGAKLKVGN